MIGDFVKVVATRNNGWGIDSRLDGVEDHQEWQTDQMSKEVMRALLHSVRDNVLDLIKAHNGRRLC